MGNKAIGKKGHPTNFTELTDHQIETLVSTTKFSVRQVREWHESFLRDYPSGILDRKQFTDVYRKFYPQGYANNFCSLAFKVFDQDKNGFIDFNEFLTAIALTMSIDLKDRLNLAFSMYDMNDDDFIDRKELAHIIMIIHEVNGKKLFKRDLTPDDTARIIIDKFDLDGDKKLSRKEFIDGCLNHSELRKLLTP